MGAPNIKWYYKAVILDQVKQWWSSHPTTLWHQIESTAIPSTPQLVLSATWMNFHAPRSYLPTVNAFIATWKAVCHTYQGIHTDTLKLLPILALQLLSPNLTIQHWYEAGIKTIGDLYLQLNLKSYQQLTREFGLSSKDFYIYLRIRHILSKLPTSTEMTSRDLLSYYVHPTNKVKGISYIYTLLS